MSAPALSAQLSCPHCRASLTYYDVAGSTHYGCSQCHTLFEYEGEGPPKILRRFQDVPKVAPALPLGSLGTLPDGIQYRVVGYSLRKEASTPARWIEYVLFSTTAGYAQLAVYEGHWTFIKPAGPIQPAGTGLSGRHGHVTLDEVDYDQYNRYSPRLLYAVGEFDYNLLDDEKLTVSEFIAPPRMLVKEKEKNQKTGLWYRAEHIEPAAVAAAFGLDKSQMPYRHGVGAIQPAPGAVAWPALKKLVPWLILLVILTQLAFAVLRPEKQLLNQDFNSDGLVSTNTVVENNARVLVSPSFVVDGPTALEVDLRAHVDNSWVELPVSLVNEQTGQGFEFTKSIEYYHGVEGGESWSEGSVEGDATLAPVPAGRYHLNVYPATENNRPVSFSLRVTEHTSLTSNVVLLVLFLLLWPALVYWRHSAHEQKRWEQSDFGA